MCHRHATDLMACTHPNQDRYLVIALQTASRNPSPCVLLFRRRRRRPPDRPSYPRQQPFFPSVRVPSPCRALPPQSSRPSLSALSPISGTVGAYKYP